MQTKSGNFIVVAMIVLLAALFKVVPHLPNFSPELVFCVYLGARFPRWLQVLFVLILLLVCDALYSMVSIYPAIGSWTVFTYSGLILLALAANCLSINTGRWQFVGYSVAATFMFWLWTNFGTWLVTNDYPHTAAGVITCYIAGLPFLGYAIVAALAWSLLIKLGLPNARYCRQGLNQRSISS